MVKQTDYHLTTAKFLNSKYRLPVRIRFQLPVFTIIMVFTVKFYKLKEIRYVNLMGTSSIAHKPENVLTIVTLALFFLVSTPRSVQFFLGLEGEPARSTTSIRIQFHETIKSKTTLTFTEFTIQIIPTH